MRNSKKSPAIGGWTRLELTPILVLATTETGIGSTNAIFAMQTSKHCLDMRHGLETSALKAMRMPSDLDELEEIDYNDPTVKAWLVENEAESIRLYGQITAEAAEYMHSRCVGLQTTRFSARILRDSSRPALREVEINVRQLPVQFELDLS